MEIRGHGRNYFSRPDGAAVRTLLNDAGLPSSDLTERHLEHFIGCGDAHALQGVIGLELYAPLALLRSLAVAKSDRSGGIGRALVEHAERHARRHGVSEIYLLTTSAERFFARAGYAGIARDDAPEAIRKTAEYSKLCPVSSALMRKRLA